MCSNLQLYKELFTDPFACQMVGPTKFQTENEKRKVFVHEQTRVSTQEQFRGSLSGTSGTWVINKSQATVQYNRFVAGFNVSDWNLYHKFMKTLCKCPSSLKQSSTANLMMVKHSMRLRKKRISCITVIIRFYASKKMRYSSSCNVAT